MTLADWGHLLLFHLSLSLLAVGGAITLAPELHRWLVTDHRWLTDSQFSNSMALAQAAPGPNVLFVAMTGWTLGLNAAGSQTSAWPNWLLAGLGSILSLLGVLAPSSVLTVLVTRWCRRHREHIWVQAFRQGLAPIVVGLLLATSWLLGRTTGSSPNDAGVWAVAIVSAVLVWRTNLHILWLLGFGAIFGAVVF